jgi:hypothetical protein
MVKYVAFISYACADTDLVENFKDHLGRYGVEAWVYSIDRTLAEDAWEEIQTKINECDIAVFIVSDHTLNAQGQIRELEIAVEKTEATTGTGRILPIVVGGTKFSSLPENLKYKNGLHLDTHSVKSTALELARRAFPDKVVEEISRHWKHPIPGEWLEVSNLNSNLEEFFDLGEPLYFRAISPMGLFECYSPKIGGLYWIFPDNVRLSAEQDHYKQLEVEIPFIFQVSGMVKIQQFGWEVWHKQKVKSYKTAPTSRLVNRGVRHRTNGD